MDNFDVLINEASQTAQDEGISFDDALLATLTDTDSSPDTIPAAAPAALSEETTDSIVHGPVPLISADVLIEALSLIIPVQIDAVLRKDRWESTEQDEAPYIYQITDALFNENMRTDMYIAADDVKAASDAGVLDETETENGYVKITSMFVPKQDISVTLVSTPIRYKTYAESES